MKIKTIIRWLVTPQTDSPTIAYYAGLYSGVVLTLQVKTLLEQRRERLMWAEMMEDNELQMHRDNLKIYPDI